MGLKNRLEFLKGLRYGKLNRKNIVMLLMIVLLGTIIFLNLGSSRTEDYSQQEALPELVGNPGEISLPTQPGGGFNFSNDFTNFPEFQPPTELFDPDLFNPDDWGGGINFTGVPGDLPDFSFPTVDFPKFTFPSFTPPAWEPPDFSRPTINPPTFTKPTVPTPTIDQNNNTNDGGFNITLPERDNKARNLPMINWFDNSSINIDFPSFPDLDISITIEGFVFVILLLSVLYLNKKFIPDLLSKLERGDHEEHETKTSQFFVSISKPSEEEVKKKERLKRLIVFADHIDELIERSQERMEITGAEDTIITGYHELDSAFAVFRKLIRTKDVTPLEHAKHTFETGEIDNDRLEEIVNLFYISRFGHRTMTEQDGWDFIDNLYNLVIKYKKGDEE